MDFNRICGEVMLQTLGEILTTMERKELLEFVKEVVFDINNKTMKEIKDELSRL